MPSEDKKNTTEEDDDLTVVESFQVNLLDLITFFSALATKINKAGATSPCSPIILDAGNTYIKSRNPVELMTNFIDKSWKDWRLCNTRNEDILFKNVKALFPVIPDSNLLTIRQMFDVSDSKGKKIVTDQDKKDIWEFVIELIRMAIMYVHSERCWGKKPDGKYGYTKVFFKDISVSSYAETFDVELSKPTSS